MTETSVMENWRWEIKSITKNPKLFNKKFKDFFHKKLYQIERLHPF